MQGGVESLARRMLEKKKGQQEYAVDLCGRAAPPFWGAFSIASVDLWAPVDDAVVLAPSTRVSRGRYDDVVV